MSTIRTRTLLAVPALFALGAVACSAEVGSTETGASTTEASSSCPSGSNDLQQRAAASTAYSIMKAAADFCVGKEGGNFGGPCFGTDILSSHHYTFSGNTIVFDPNDERSQYIPQQAKMALAVGQLDSSVASFLVQGLQWARANTNGAWVPLIMPTQALSSFTYPGNGNRIQILDSRAGGNRRGEVVTGSAWCNTAKIHFADSSTYEAGFSPFNVISVQDASETRNLGNFKGSKDYPTTPFNGPNNTNNPYLVISVNGSTINWNTSGAAFPVQNCPNGSCSGTIDIDPIGYTLPGPYYDANSQPVGAQSNPFQLIITRQYADPAHAGQWATRTIAGVQEWGTFSQPTNVMGGTVYQYVKVM
ncbi:MAG: hypothetical protein M3O46_02580 [Myxococcota bacterium]|nr:hypothetical protein [Myxococcota bacterium]